nr:DUF3750 domain-containing protein [uncultured Desulfobacter sp.]
MSGYRFDSFWGWRGWFAIHTWIAKNKTGEDVYTIYDVVGWQGHHGNSVFGTAVIPPWGSPHQASPNPKAFV